MQQVIFSLLFLLTVTLPSPASGTRCFLQPSLGGVPNESTSPLLCTLMSSRESSEDEDEDKSLDSDGIASVNNDLSSTEDADLDEVERETRQEPGHKFMRFGRASTNHNFLRFGREPEHKFLRFGREHKFLRFGRAVPNSDNRNKMAVLPKFMRLGRGPEHVFMRFGRQGSKSDGHKFMRFGRTQNDGPVQDQANVHQAKGLK